MGFLGIEILKINEIRDLFFLLFEGRIFQMQKNYTGGGRRSIRLKGYDYSQEGAYFVTICVQNKECLFGEVVDGQMCLNDAGRMVQKWWKELDNKFLNFELNTFVVMPNHFHAIVVIKNVGADLCVCPDEHVFNENCVPGEHIDSPLPKIIQWFKTMTTNEYICGVRLKKFPPFKKRIWQRNYYEHIIRNEESFKKIQEYILHNPENWKNDKFFE